jgi:hypothetical protein
MRRDELPGADASLGEDAGVDAGADAGRCEAEPERCDGRDNDCNGQIDDGLAPESCEGGGAFRFCVGGVLSACPRVCEACRPGSTRVCFTTYCTRWGHESCSADGLAWGSCAEDDAPVECRGEEDTWDAADDSPATEQCCIDRGDCCKDHWDLDGDGDTSESVGACDRVTCD